MLFDCAPLAGKPWLLPSATASECQATEARSRPGPRGAHFECGVRLRRRRARINRFRHALAGPRTRLDRVEVQCVVLRCVRERIAGRELRASAACLLVALALAVSPSGACAARRLLLPADPAALAPAPAMPSLFSIESETTAAFQRALFPAQRDAPRRSVPCAKSNARFIPHTHTHTEATRSLRVCNAKPRHERLMVAVAPRTSHGVSVSIITQTQSVALSADYAAMPRASSVRPCRAVSVSVTVSAAHCSCPRRGVPRACGGWSRRCQQSSPSHA